MLKIEINTTSAAFTNCEEPREELHSRLHEIIERIDAGENGGLLFDYTGDKCGVWKLTGVQ